MTTNAQAWHDATARILAALNITDVYRELGVEVTGQKPSSKGWLECRAFGIEDRTPSAGINVGGDLARGRYKDFRSGESLTLFDFAATKAGRFAGDWREARKHYARAASVELPSGEDEIAADRFEFSDVTAGTLMLYAQGKAGISATALKELGVKGARWPKKLSPEKQNHLLVFPMYGAALLDVDPTGWHCVAQNPRQKIRQFQGKGNDDRLLDKMTAGEYGLMNVDGLTRLAEADVVHIVEGLTDLAAAQTVLSPWRTADPQNRKHVVLSSGACTYHPKAEWMQHFAGKKVWLWFDVGDAKDEGQVAAKVWVAALLPVALEIRNVQLPLGADGGKNDLRAWLVGDPSLNKPAHNYNDMLDYAATFDPVDPADHAQKLSTHEAILANLGITVIGQHEGHEWVEIFCERTRRSHTIREIDKLTYTKLIQFCGPEVIETYVHDGRETVENKYDLKAVKNAVAAQSSSKTFRNDELFGAGVWEADEQLIVVQSREVGLLNGTAKLERSHIPFFNGRVLDTGAGTEEWCDLATLNRHLADAEKQPFCQAAIEDAARIFGLWYWKQKHAPLILAGLVACTWLQTVWRWRPQVFITGGSDTGKSNFLDDVLHKGIFGKLAMYHEKVTEAAISQHMRHHARVLLLDEFEKDQHRQKIFELFRTSSRGGVKIRGTADQRGMKFRLKHLPWMGAINTGLRSQADRNRFIIFDLDEIPKERRGIIDLPTEDWMHDLGLRLLAMALRHYQEVRKRSTILRSTRAEGVPGRVVESFALPCAMLSVASGATEEAARGYMLEILASWDFGTQSVRDDVDLLQTILTSEIRMDGGQMTTVEALLDKGYMAPDSSEALGRHGIRKIKKKPNALGEYDEVFWVCPEVMLRTILSRTDFAGQSIDQYLMRLSGAKRSRQRLTGGGFYSGVEIPWQTLAEIFHHDQQDGESEAVGTAQVF